MIICACGRLYLMTFGGINGLAPLSLVMINFEACFSEKGKIVCYHHFVSQRGPFVSAALDYLFKKA